MMFETFAEHYGIEGIVGVRAITYYGGRFFSPVYGYCEWHRETQTAKCAIGCGTVPGDRHQGCGFHSFWAPPDAKRFVEQIRATEACLVLIECFGRVVMHELGLRAEKARIVAVLDWDPRTIFASWRSPGQFSKLAVPMEAVRAFQVPLIDEHAAEDLILSQREAVFAS